MYFYSTTSSLQCLNKVLCHYYPLFRHYFHKYIQKQFNSLLQNWTVFLFTQKVISNFHLSLLLLHRTECSICSCVVPFSLSICPSLTASLIEIMLSSAFSVTHTQKWDMFLPPQSVSVTELTLGRGSGHFALFSFSLPLSTHLSFGAQMEPLQAKEAWAVNPTFCRNK